MGFLQQPRRRWRLYLKEWRDSRGLTQEQVAERMGVDFQTISRWERYGDGRSDERKPDPDDISGLAEIYDCEPEDFYHDPGEPTLNAMVRDKPADVRRRAIRMLRSLLDEG